MRFVVKAKNNAPPDYADRAFRKDNGKPLSRGDEIELSGAGFEMVMNEQSDYVKRFGNQFEFVREIPETPEEKERAKPRLMKAELLQEKKADLVKTAEKLDLPTSLKKEELVDEIVEAKTTDKVDSVSTPLTAATGAENPKAVKRGKN